MVWRQDSVKPIAKSFTMILKNKEGSLKSFKQTEDNTQRSKQTKRTRFVFKLQMKRLLRRMRVKKGKYNLLGRQVASVRKTDLVFATSHGFFGQNTEPLTLSSEPFENSLVNSIALRLAIQNLWQEVTIIKTSSFPDESKPAQKVSNRRRSLRFSDWSVPATAAMSLVLRKRLTCQPPHGRKDSSFGGIFHCLES